MTSSLDKAKRFRYEEYALVVLALTLSIFGIINFGGILPISPNKVIGGLLTAFGIYTIAYSLNMSEERFYRLFWGYIAASIGIALYLIDMIDIFLTLSISLFIAALLYLIFRFRH